MLFWRLTGAPGSRKGWKQGTGLRRNASTKKKKKKGHAGPSSETTIRSISLPISSAGLQCTPWRSDMVDTGRMTKGKPHDAPLHENQHGHGPRAGALGGRPIPRDRRNSNLAKN